MNTNQSTITMQWCKTGWGRWGIAQPISNVGWCPTIILVCPTTNFGVGGERIYALALLLCWAKICQVDGWQTVQKHVHLRSSLMDWLWTLQICPTNIQEGATLLRCLQSLVKISWKRINSWSYKK